MSSYIFDTHSHYDDKAFDSDRDEILGGLLAKGIGKVVDVGADMPSSKMALELAKQYEFVYAALGVHPSEVEGLTEDDMAWISSHAAHEKVAAIGAQSAYDDACRPGNPKETSVEDITKLYESLL